MTFESMTVEEYRKYLLHSAGGPVNSNGPTRAPARAAQPRGSPTKNPQTHPGLEDEPSTRTRSKLASPEEDLQIECMQWVEIMRGRIPLLRWMLHVPNGGKRTRAQAGRFKAMGTRKGFPDIFWPVPAQDAAGLALELKSPTGQPSQDQCDWARLLCAMGWKVYLIRTFEEFRVVVQSYAEKLSVPPDFQPGSGSRSDFLVVGRLAGLTDL